MRAKKANRRPGSIRYLLSLDRTLQRASLRKMEGRVKPTKKRATRTASKPAARAASKSAGRAASRPVRSAVARSTAEQPQPSFDRRTTIMIASICFVAAVALIGFRKPGGDTLIAQVDKGGQVSGFEPVSGVLAADTSADEPVSPQRPTRALAASAPAPAPKSTALERAPEPAAAPETAPRPAAAPEPMKHLAPPRTAAAGSDSTEHTPVSTNGEQEGTPATIAGCLGVEDDSFWLKNVSGDAAPKSRSWKSGFLRKKSSSIELVDRATTRRLAAYVGQRIETTGLLVDRQMRVKALRVLGSCD